MNWITTAVRQFRFFPQINVMLSSNQCSCIHSFSAWPGLLSSTSSEIKSLAPVFHGLRVVEPHCRPIPKRWKVSCFRNDELFSSEAQPDVPGEKILCEKSQTYEVGKPSSHKRDLISSLAEVADIVLRVTGKRWTVPWTADTIVQVALLWVVSFWFIGSWMIPFGAHLFGFRPLPSGWFKFNLRGKWLFDVILGCLMFPLVNWLSQFNLYLLPILPSTPATLSSIEQSIMARDPVAMGLYALVLVVCAPLWEEIVFRGFLLPSLTKYMPVWCSILVSSIAFALAHFNVQRMLPLIFLGMVMGVIYARSMNLLPSIVLHSFWNGFVFLDLMK